MRGHIRPYILKSGQRQWAIVLYEGKKPNKDGNLRDSYRWIRGFKTQKLAQLELTKLLRAKDDGSYIEPSDETLGKYLDRWLATYAKPNVAGKTYERYQQIVERDIKPKLGAHKLSKLQPVQIAEFYAWAMTSGRKKSEGGLSAQTVLHIHRLLRKALQQAVIWQLRPTNPADAVEAPKPVKIEMRAIDEDRSAWLMAASAGTQFYIPVMYALSTGLRRGEILAQRWSDVDLENGRLVVIQSLEQTRAGGLRFKTPKSNKHRGMTMLPLLVEALRVHRADQENCRKLFGKDYRDDLGLVIALPDGSAWAPDSFTAAYGDFTEKIGMKGIRFHDLRHSHASQLLSQGVPVKTVQQRLGHANASITMNTYAHVMAGDDEKATEIMERRLRSAIEKQHPKTAH